MKLDEWTIRVLKHFATINGCVYVRPGNVVYSMAESKSIIARARLDQSFEKPFGIHQLPRFFSAISLFSDPDIEFHDNHMTIKSGRRRLDYTYAGENAVLTVPAGKDIPEIPADVRLKVPYQVIADVSKACGALSLPEVVISSDGAEVTVGTGNVKDPSTDVYRDVITEHEGQLRPFSFVFKVENLKLVQSDYSVALSFDKRSLWSGEKIDYLIGVEDTSKT